ncbi:MAG: TonB-dependent receptor [Sphingomonadales bacterium]|nr:TonB-dependent receptor [Sphingomonadales bacterium]
MWRDMLAVSTATAALMIHTGAQGQDADSPNTSQGLENIIVTAEKRAETIQSVPVSVSAFDEASFERDQIFGVQDLHNAVPGLSVQRNPNSSNGASIFLRGIGQDNSTILDEVGVGIYLDGVYMGRNIGALLDLNNFERIEVLRGPQGTLYGRNTTGGAIKLISRRPDVDRFSFHGDVTVGSFDRLDVRGAANIPMGDGLAANISFISLTDDGYYRNEATGQHLNTKNVQALRGALSWTASDRLSVFLTVDYSVDRSSIQVGTQMLGTAPPDDEVPLFTGIFDSRPDVDDVNDFEGWGAALTLTYETGAGTLQSISAYRGFDYKINLDLAGAGFGLDLLRDTQQDQISQELQFTSDFSDRFSLVAGLYYFREEASEDLFLAVLPDIVFPSSPEQTSQSVAVYGQFEYVFTPWLTGIVGGRFTYDKKTVGRNAIFDGITASENWSRFTPKVGLSADWGPDRLIFVTYSQGYKAGVFQPFPTDPLTASAALEPETIDAIELGVKADWLERRLRTNIALFRNKFENIQLSLLSDGGAVESLSADLIVKGIEAEVTLIPVDGLRLYASGALMDSEFTAVPPMGVGTPRLGEGQKFTPDFTGRIGAEYTWDVRDDHELTLGVSYDWTGEQSHGYPAAITSQGGFGLLDARLAFNHRDGYWGIELAGENLADDIYWTYTSYLAGLTRFYQPGRTWSLRLKGAF